MQLSPPAPTGPAPTDVAVALTRALEAWGQRPAITVHSPRGREEQGFASLSQWAAKGAHLLELELHLSPGDTIGLDAPVSWPSAAVCLAAWWSGIAVRLGPSAAEVVVVHTSRDRPPPSSEVLWLGDAVDGAPTEQAAVAGEAWVRAVQSFPDQPPLPRATAGTLALVTDGRSLDHAAALALADGHGPGTLGLELASADPLEALISVTLRPLLTGRPTVVLDGVGREVAAGEKVAHWA